jgi:hypothetical protein
VITVSVTYDRSDIPESLIVKGKKVDQQDLRMRLDRLIEKALEGAGMEWYASGTDLTTAGLIRESVFDCDLEKILNAPTEWEINAEFAQAESKEAEVFAVT